jgi:hypothetical protein
MMISECHDSANSLPVLQLDTRDMMLLSISDCVMHGLVVSILQLSGVHDVPAY